MLIRIFMPQSIYNGKEKIDAKCQYIYGAVESDERDNILSFYVIDSSASADQAKQCKQLIGIIAQDADAGLPGIEHQYLQFKRSETSLTLQTVHLSQSSSASSSRKAQIFLYDSDVFAQLSQRYRSQQSINDDGAIGVLLRRICDAEEGKRATAAGHRRQTCRFRIIHHAKALKTFIHSHTTYIDSAFLKHFLLWTENLEQFTYQTGRIWTIFFDLFAGIMIMLFLWRISNADEYLMEFTMIIVENLQRLLDALDGSPVGLKLNEELNAFFLTIFRYHADLWATFLVIVAPVVKHLFVPITIIGCFGLSFQLSMLVDLLNIITLHAHCIYIYVSILYRVERNGLPGLWRIVTGRRENALKKRIESHEYTNSQLYLAALFFAALLFLLPTCLVYYAVFASLHFGFNCITYALTVIRQRLLCLPLLDIVKWCFGKCYSTDNFEIVPVTGTGGSSSDKATVFKVQTIRTLPRWFQLTMPPEPVKS